LKVTFPDKLAFLSEPHRYKVLYGGRGGIKSWSVAQHLLIAGAKQALRIPCARETMKSIKESVHQLLEDQITRLGLQTGKKHCGQCGLSGHSIRTCSDITPTWRQLTRTSVSW
jgi:phage terminase large subunit